jgi:hypothetical protein
LHHAGHRRRAPARPGGERRPAGGRHPGKGGAGRALTRVRPIKPIGRRQPRPRRPNTAATTRSQRWPAKR